MANDQNARFHISDAHVEGYRAVLKDKYRPPSKGGNTRAWHQHSFSIGDERFSFLALGARKWIYQGDSVSFDWQWDQSKTYRNVDPDTVMVRDKSGAPIVRGERGGKKWRTATTRLPARRSEWRD